MDTSTRLINPRNNVTNPFVADLASYSDSWLKRIEWEYHEPSDALVWRLIYGFFCLFMYQQNTSLPIINSLRVH